MGGFRFTVEKVFSIPGRGVVVSGKIDEGRIAVGQEVGFLGANGRWTNVHVVAIEVAHQLVEEAEAGQNASFLLEGVKKNQIVPGTLFLEPPQTSAESETTEWTGSPDPPASGRTALPPGGEVPTTFSQGEAIHPSSGIWRIGIFLFLGALIILILLFFQGAFDPFKEIKKRSAIGGQQSDWRGEFLAISAKCRPRLTDS